MIEEWENRLKEIDQRINDLQEHIMMWARAGGDKLAMRGLDEISALKKEKEKLETQIKLAKEDKENGTNKLESYLIRCKIEELKELKKQVNFIKKLKLNSQISNEEHRLQTLQGSAKK